MRPDTTIILPTYGRPDTLACAIRSVELQTHARWRLFVIGDACDAATAAAVAPFLDDPRITYLNLPWRCGEQALPNSVWPSLPETDYLAFLNHDDLWLPSHLARASAQIGSGKGDFFIGRSLYVNGWRDGRPLDEQPFTLSPIPRRFAHAFRRGIHYIEPASAWVVKRSLAQRIGPWRRSGDLFRRPIQDWFLRAWRAGAVLVEEPRVTTLKFETHWREEAEGPNYGCRATAQEAVTAMLEDTDRARALTGHLDLLAASGQSPRHGTGALALPGSQAQARRLEPLLRTRGVAAWYRWTGRDLFDLLAGLTGAERGGDWKAALRARTGESALHPPDLDRLLAYVGEATRGERPNDAR